MVRLLSLLLAPVGFLLLLQPPAAAAAESLTKHHALSLIGEPELRA